MHVVIPAQWCCHHPNSVSGIPRQGLRRRSAVGLTLNSGGAQGKHLAESTAYQGTLTQIN
jgi:hypothetical protein